MTRTRAFRRRLAVVLILSGLIAIGLLNAISAVAAPPPPPFDGTSISTPLGAPGNVYGDGSFGGSWCAPAAAGSSIANQQGTPLALIPQESTACTLEKFQNEASAAGIPARLTFQQVGTSAGGRPWYYAIVNALETPQQQADYANWQQIRGEELTDPAQAQADLAAFGENVKIPIFWENNIHGDEEEGDDAMMQVIRDLVTTPLGTNEFVDEVLNHVVLIIVPNMNPDGRFIGQRANSNSYDMNRDFLVQSQPEVQHEVALMQQWLPTGAIDTHGYVNPGLTDGLTKPHNPGIEYDLFLKWNQPRLDANRAAMQGIGENNTHPVNDWCPNGDLASGPDFNCASTRAIAASPTGLVYDDTTGVVTVTTTGLNDLGQGALFQLSGGGTAAYSPGGVCTAPNHCTVKDPIPLQSTTFTYQLAPGLGLAPSGDGVVTMRGGPAVAQGWDDWGPFYTQTYQAYFGADSSTSEMCNNNTAGNLPGICRPGGTGAAFGRLGGKLDQYEVFWSSVHYWTPVRNEMMHDQVEIFRRGVTGADRFPCCDGTTREGVPLHDLGFWADQHDWSIPYPTAFVIPFSSGNLGVGQRNDLEANNLAQWMLNNGIRVHTLNSDYTWGTTTFPAGSYVIWMNQALRGLALTALDAGQDVSNRANQLYAPPGAWSHGNLWGADTYEVPHGDGSFSPATTLVATTNALVGGVRDGIGAPSDFYSLTSRGWREYATLSSLLHSGVLGEVSEAPFTSTTGGLSPAGTLIFPNDSHTAAALDAAGEVAGVFFERNVGVTKPATTLLNRAPRVAILVNNANPAENFQSFSLRRIFGSDAAYLSVTAGTNSIQNAATDPLLNVDLIYNTGQAWPGAASATARARLNAFFGRGGGYIASGASTNNFAFLSGATSNAGAAAPLASPLTASNQGAGGGDALWTNVGGAASPVIGGYPGQDHIFIPSNVRWFSAMPASAVVDGRYLADMAGAGGNGPNAGFVAGLWRNRNTATNNAAILLHGPTSPSGTDRPNASRYCALADDPLGARGDGERMWALIVQCSLWTTMTDESKIDQTITFASIGPKAYLDADFLVSPTSSSGLPVSVAASGDCTVSPSVAPATVHIIQAGSCTITASQAGNANYNAVADVPNTFAIGEAQISALSPVHTWVGLKNSDDTGTSFDVKVELLKNGTIIETGLSRCITGIPRNVAGKLIDVPWTFAAATVDKGDILSLRVSTRIGTNSNDTKCAGHNGAAGLRLYYDTAAQASRLGATIGSVPVAFTEYLRSDGKVCNNAESTAVTSRTLDATAPAATPAAKCKDSTSVNFGGGNPYKEIGTWGTVSSWILP